jgi:hypothetical protein
MEGLEARSKGAGVDTPRSRLTEFFATVDLQCEILPRAKRAGLPPFLLKTFQSEENFWHYANRLQTLRDTASSNSRLIDSVASLLSDDPLYFLVLMHLHRQIRFTNLELVNAFFDRDKLNDLAYYRWLSQHDPTFAEVVNTVSKSKGWQNYMGAIRATGQSRLEPEAEDTNVGILALNKKAVTKYLGSEGGCWHLWESRIRSDSSVRTNIARFVVENEDLGDLVQEKTVLTALGRSLRIVNVELVKRERGEFGSRRVKEILEDAGFKPLAVKGVSNISDVTRLLPASSDFLYLQEIPWKEQDKRFDFVLARRGKIGFVIETNYFTTSMSKIREVVKHFRELKIACRGKYRLVYITDGMGWFNLMKTVRDMIEFEKDELEIEPSKIPYLMNLELFRRGVSQVKDEM